jgi:predicted AAA+ superfamily ATPase
MNTELLERVINDQENMFKRKDAGVMREILPSRAAFPRQVLVLTGIRRSGKSTLLRQIANLFDSYYYLNFDDERLASFTIENFDTVLLLWKKKKQANVVLLDEVQNVDGWERFVRRINDEGMTVVVTGSNAKLLSRELATRLTGRHKRIELFPFSLKEYLAFSEFNIIKRGTSDATAQLLHYTENYLEHGGFPEYWKLKDDEYLQRVYEDILFRDLIVRFKIRDAKAFRRLANYLFTNFTSEISYTKLHQTLGIKTTATVRAYISHLEESYLLYELFRFDYSLKKQNIYQKKIYVVDGGLRNSVAFRFSGDSGKLLENVVYLNFRRAQKDVYFHKAKRECDFIIVQKGTPVSAVQVCANVTGENIARECEGLLEAQSTYNIQSGVIVTQYQNEIINFNNHNIRLIPIHDWLLQD